MKVQVVTVDRAGGKKLCVQVVYQVNGKTKKQNKETFGLNEKRKAEALRSKLENSDKIDVIDQKIDFNFAFEEYFKKINNDPDTTSKYKDMQIAYINNHVRPYIYKTYLADYLLADFEEKTLLGIKKSKALQWVKKDGFGYYKKKEEKIGKVTIRAAVLEFKKFVNFCASRKWKIDFTISNFKFAPKYFDKYQPMVKWMPTTPELLAVVNKEPDIQLRTLYKFAAESGGRLNELLGVCYENIETDGIYIDHSINEENNFRPYQVKTQRRFVELSDECLELFNIWMKAQMFPITHRNVTFLNPDTNKMEKRTFKRVFNIPIHGARKRIKVSAKRLGIHWPNGMSPFRKWSITMATDAVDQNGKKVFTEKQIDNRFGNSKDIRQSNYLRDLNLNEKQRKTAINLITKG